jgi:hypothetical protein
MASILREGHEIGPGVRREPEQTLREGSIVRERLKSGMNPYEAMRLPFD